MIPYAGDWNLCISTPVVGIVDEFRTTAFEWNTSINILQTDTHRENRVPKGLFRVRTKKQIWHTAA